MLGHVSLSETPISSISKILEGNAEMSGIASKASAGIGILVGVADISAIFVEEVEGAAVPDIPVTSMSFNFGLDDIPGRFVKGTELETDIEFLAEQSSAGIGVFTGASTQDFNLTQTATGELLFTEIVPSVTVTYTEITHTGDNWTEITHTGDTWTDVSTNQELQMASSYTANNGIEKIGTGEQAGTWGATTNTNFDILDRAINGVGAITLSGTTHTLTTTDGALSDGHFKVLVFGGTLSSTNTITISPNDQDKLYFVFNNTSGSQSIIIKQGSGATVTVGNGKTAIVYADGAGSGAAVAQIETGSDEFTEDVTMKTGDGALLTLQTSDTTVVDGDVLGALQFQAPNESSGTDAITVAASIVAEADDTFAADSNKTDMLFKLGSSEAATEKMRLTHEGDIDLRTDDRFIFFGADSDVTLRHVHNTGLLLNSTNQLQFGDSGTYIHQSADGVLDLVSDTEIEINATTIDMNGALDVSGQITSAGALTCAGIVVGAASLQEADLVQIDGITAGTVSASKAVIVDSNKDASGFRNITATGTVQGAEVTATSDERLKSDIETIDNALDKVMNMRGVSYVKQAEKGIGVIAQEIEKVLPEVVTDGEYKSVAYGNIVGVLIEAIKEQQKQIDELKKDKHGSSNQWYNKSNRCS